MNSLELAKAVESDPCIDQYCVGVVSADRLPKVTNLPMAFIGNLDDSKGTGSHWVAVFASFDTTEYFCSYGKKPKKEYLVYLNKNFKNNWDYNNHRVQAPLTSTCGQHALFYLLNRCRGMVMSDILKLYSDVTYNDEMVTEIVNNYFGLDTVAADADFILEQLLK